MNKLLLFLTLLCCSLICYGQGVVKSVCVERNASGNERYAAAQLRKFLHKGGISTDTVAKKRGTIYVGNTPYLRKHFASYIDSLHDDSYLICGDGKNLCLYGKGNKGTLYAVYAFLEMIGSASGATHSTPSSNSATPSPSTKSRWTSSSIPSRGFSCQRELNINAQRMETTGTPLKYSRPRTQRFSLIPI